VDEFRLAFTGLIVGFVAVGLKVPSVVANELFGHLGAGAGGVVVKDRGCPGRSPRGNPHIALGRVRTVRLLHDLHGGLVQLQ